MSEAIYDVTDPARPTFLGRWTVPTGGSVHDQAVEGDTAWVAWTTGWSRLDLSDPAAPTEVWRAEADWEAPFVHNFAPTAEGDLVAMSEEKADGALRVWDVTGDAPVLRESYVTLPEHSIHNVAVRDRIAYAA
jgi:hypothetical protein